MMFWINFGFSLLALLLKVWGHFSEPDRVEALRLLSSLREKLGERGAGHAFLLKRRSRLLEMNRLCENNGLGKLL